MLGTHIGGPVAHTTGRTHRLEFRAATALLGHYGIEWDLRGLDAVDRAQVAAWVALHKRVRPALAGGRVVRGDHPDPALLVTGVVSADTAEAWYVVATVDTLATQAPTAVLLPGLDPSRTYRLTREDPPGARHVADLGESWLDGDGVEVSGAVLSSAGVRLPVTAPESAYVLHATRLD
jgi:alpha-galactosidase